MDGCRAFYFLVVLKSNVFERTRVHDRGKQIVDLNFGEHQMWFILLWGIGLFSALVHFSIVGFSLNFGQVCEILLLHQFVVTFVLVGIIGVITNIAAAELSSQRLGWHGGPYQIKYGFTQAHLGIIGLMAIWFHGNFWVGPMVAMYLYVVSGVWTHIQEILKKGKLDVNHFGSSIMGVLYALFITALSIFVGNVWHF